MPFPEPKPGQVIRYSYLWKHEYDNHQEEGVKDRPSAVIMVTKGDDGERLVTVLPVTHTPPSDLELAVEIPQQTKQRLGLDDERSWIVLSEANRFLWPGPDLRVAKPSNPSSVVYGYLPANFFELVRAKFIAAAKAQRARLIRRSQ
ncbi:MAG TPA: hypothetical protein VKY19_14230 [Ktedonosporobacter sp.]|jgi:uncharacterized protein YifN (PemK superfamily)|nr:hypothetical protein [Ktedonosporobacter sp.]